MKWEESTGPQSWLQLCLYFINKVQVQHTGQIPVFTEWLYQSTHLQEKHRQSCTETEQNSILIRILLLRVIKSGMLKSNCKSRVSMYWLFISETDSDGLQQQLPQGCTEPDAVSSNKTRQGDAAIKWALKERSGNFKRICISNFNFIQALNSLNCNDLLPAYCHASLTCYNLFLDAV